MTWVEIQIRNHAFKRTLLRPLWWRKWIRTHLPMQETEVRSLTWDDPTCLGAIKPECHYYWASKLQRLCPHAKLLKPMLHKRSHHKKQPKHCSKEQPPLTPRESPCEATKIQCSQKQINSIFLNTNFKKGPFSVLVAAFNLSASEGPWNRGTKMQNTRNWFTQLFDFNYSML